jgi:ERCC4-type nuclease
MLFIDSNENSTEGMKKTINVIKNEGREFYVKPLDAGDVVVLGQSKAYIIEIKREGDLLSSMNSDRMWSELARMKEAKVEGKEVIPILLFEGNMKILSWRYGGSYGSGGQRKTKYLFRSKGEIKSALARLHSILNVWKIPLMTTADYYQTGLYISWLDESIDREKKEKELRISIDIPKDIPPEKMAFEILGAIVGGKTAIAILRKYKTLYNVARSAYVEGVKGFEGLKYEDGRKIPQNLIKRLVDIFTVSGENID